MALKAFAAPPNTKSIERCSSYWRPAGINDRAGNFAAFANILHGGAV
jgi:hypothetical protein